MTIGDVTLAMPEVTVEKRGSSVTIGKSLPISEAAGYSSGVTGLPDKFPS